MKEDFIQFVWQYRLISSEQLFTVSGKRLEILLPGELNRNSGPDFFNARIKLDGLTLAGNVELHVQSSDWERHGHQNDKSYNNLILHVVYEHDRPLEQNKKYNVEVLELKGCIDPDLLMRFNNLLGTKTELPCASQLKHCSDSTFAQVLDRMLEIRLNRKSQIIESQFNHLNEHYTQTYYGLLLRNFGFQLNAPAFELLSRALPLHLLLRHVNDLLQLEALLLGTAGLLEQQLEEDYPRQLQNEFEFLRQKYILTPLDRSLLKYSRTRPSNFPDLRLAQFASLVHAHPELLQAPQENTEWESVRTKFNVRAGEYWQTHYRLQLKTSKKIGQLGVSSAELLIINSLSPFLWYYGAKQHRMEFKEKAIDLLRSCATENNRKIRLFRVKTSCFVSAAQSQAGLELYDEYCRQQRCMDCAVAADLLKTPG